MDETTMPSEVRDRLDELLKSSQCYLEYGTGASTVHAVELRVPRVFAVENDMPWLVPLEKSLHALGSKTKWRLQCVDTGPVGPWGYPLGNTRIQDWWRYPLDVWRTVKREKSIPDLIFIDGRFRIACLLACLLHAVRGTRILWDDYRERTHYHEVERFLKPDRFTDRCAEFIVAETLNRDRVWKALLPAVMDPR